MGIDMEVLFIVISLYVLIEVLIEVYDYLIDKIYPIRLSIEELIEDRNGIKIIDVSKLSKRECKAVLKHVREKSR